MTTIPKLDVVFLDTGLYATEGFTSGLLIFLKNTLKKFSSQGLNVGILSCVNQNNALPQSKHEGLRVRDDNGISVFEIIMNDQDSSNDDIVIKNYNYLLEATKPQIIIMNTPAVFLDHKDILIRELAQKTGSNNYIASYRKAKLLVSHQESEMSLKRRLELLPIPLKQSLTQTLFNFPLPNEHQIISEWSIFIP